MKPTQEQVIAWALKAGLVGKGQTVCTYADISDLELAFALAYEAGRKDENEACAKVVEDSASIIDYPSVHMGGASKNAERKAEKFADAIRARREQ